MTRSNLRLGFGRGFSVVCRTAEVVWHTFFIANPKMFLTFALAIR